MADMAIRELVLMLCVILAYAQSRPQFGFVNNLVSDTVPKILRNDFIRKAAGYFFNVDTSDGFHHHQRGLTEPPTAAEDEGLEVQGSYSYIGPDGIKYTVQYTAGKNGFEPYGTHIPESAGVRKLGIGSCAEASLCGTQFG